MNHFGAKLNTFNINPVGNYMLKVNSKNTRTRCEICLKLTIKTTERPDCCRSGVVIVNFEQVNAGWEVLIKGAIPRIFREKRQEKQW